MPVKLLNNITHFFIHTYFKYYNITQTFQPKGPSLVVNILNSITTLLKLLNQRTLRHCQHTQLSYNIINVTKNTFFVVKFS